MAEEQRCQAQEGGHRLCVNNCGLFGSPATMNLCSKCYQDFHQLGASAVKPSVSPAAAPPLCLPESVSIPAQTASVLPEVNSEAGDGSACRLQPSNRCTVCRRRVGLTGFRCRCGITFCGTHRYPEKHGCEFDFKRAGREEIARANPVVKAEKLRRI